MTVQHSKAEQLQGAIRVMAYAAYAAAGAVFVLSFLSFAGTGRQELAAGIGIVLSIVIVFVTSYLHKKTELLSRLDPAEETETRKKQNSKMAHDIRNCLAVIKMDAEAALLNTEISDEIKETLNTINSEADKINTLLS